MILLDAYVAADLLRAIERDETRVEVSLDLGISTTVIDLRNQAWTVEQLKKIAADENSIYFLDDNKEIYKAALRGNRFYKLHSTGRNSPPALLIDGVLMHRVKEVNPLQDAQMKADLCAQPDFNMLEVCTGLGYSTISCLRRGIRSIVTIEIDEDVIRLARLNPWSQNLFSDERVTMIMGDAAEKVTEFGENQFDAVLHDPPRFSMGSGLYAQQFYAQLHRVLKVRGVLYHYVGNPGERYRKQDLQKGIMERLRQVGFTEVKRETKTQGVLARKG